MNIDEKENGRVNLINQLNEILELAKRVFNKTDYQFKGTYYYGSIWLDVMKCLEHNGQNAEEGITRKFFKAYIVFDSIMYLEKTKAYFDRSRAAWEEKLINLFEAPDEETFDSLCYEFYIGSNMSMEDKTIYFCNMDTSVGESNPDSLCEFFIEPRLFIECKNLFGVSKNAINNNIRKANQQIRSTIQQIKVHNPIGVTFLDLSEKLEVNDRNLINEKIVEALQRLRQCNETHFLVVTYMNVVTEKKDSTAYIKARLIVNPIFKNTILTKENLMLFNPRFRMVFIPSEDYKSFDVYDFIIDQRKNGVDFDEFFCE